MYMKQLSEYSSSDQVFVLNAAGAAVASFVIVVLVIAGCAVDRLRRSRKNGNSNRERNGNSRGETSIQNENEYQIPVTNGSMESSQGNATNVYMVPQPNIVYIDLDKQALKNSDRAMPASSPTEYAVIDAKRSGAANKPEERHYANINNTSVKEPSIYANI